MLLNQQASRGSCRPANASNRRVAHNACSACESALSTRHFATNGLDMCRPKSASRRTNKSTEPARLRRLRPMIRRSTVG
jgi:hypothetical protein